MLSGMRLFFKNFSASIVGFAALPISAFAVDLIHLAADAEAQRECRDRHGIEVLALWLDALPAESRVLIEDPVVRKAAGRFALRDRELLGEAGKRIFVAQMARQRRIDTTEMLRRISEMQRDGTRTFPISLEQALRADTSEARAYINAAAISVRKEAETTGLEPLAYIHAASRSIGRLTERAGRDSWQIRSILRQQREIDTQVVNSRCGDLFRSYLVDIDERVAFVPGERENFGGRNPYILQTKPGTDVLVRLLTPAEGCKRSPTGEEFFQVQKNGRVAGKYSSLGFPEVVQLSFSTSSMRWTCSGVLLDSNWVLTAAHCVDNNGGAAGQSVESSAMFNNAVSKLKRANGATVVRAATTGAPIVHESYIEAVRQGWSVEKKGSVDLALLSLSIALEPGFVPHRDSATAPGSVLGTLAGYGATQQGPAVDIANAPLDVGWLRLAVSSSLISWEPVGDHGALSNASCPGDSGAPIYMALAAEAPAPDEPAIGCAKERRELIGIVSFGQSVGGMCTRGSFGAGPRLHPHLPWICKKTGLMCS